MARLSIEPGACGLSTVVEVVKGEGKSFSVRITSDCEMVERLGERLKELGMMDAFKKILDNPVYREGSLCLKHVSCPVPCGILKALEVEAGLAVPRDVTMRFMEKEGERTS
jgi:hypothetical protein